MISNIYTMTETTVLDETSSTITTSILKTTSPILSTVSSTIHLSTAPSTTKVMLTTTKSTTARLLIASTTRSRSTRSVLITCDGSIDAAYECLQCGDVTTSKYLWGSSCKAKKLFSTTMVIGVCGLDYACVTTGVGECPYNDFCTESIEGIFL